MPGREKKQTEADSRSILILAEMFNQAEQEMRHRIATAALSPWMAINEGQLCPINRSKVDSPLSATSAAPNRPVVGSYGSGPAARSRATVYGAIRPSRNFPIGPRSVPYQSLTTRQSATAVSPTQTRVVRGDGFTSLARTHDALHGSIKPTPHSADPPVHGCAATQPTTRGSGSARMSSEITSVPRTITSRIRAAPRSASSDAASVPPRRAGQSAGELPPPT